MTYKKKKDLSKLKHIEKNTKEGACIIVLDTGAVLDAEATAMLQALHSRSNKGLKGHMEILKQRGPEKFMENFYVGYGHKSIGDLGSTTIFIEGVSMLAAKAIQDWPLYSGQESSTRYIDFSSQKIINPAKNKIGEEILESWRQFYIKSLPILMENLKTRFPKDKNEDEKVYTKAIKARAFDILRAFLPAGTSTNLAWHTNLRQAADKLEYLRHHPLKEVKDIAKTLEKALQEAHPSSFVHKKYKEKENYNEKVMENYYFHKKDIARFKLIKACMNDKLLKSENIQTLLSTRPDKTELPKHFAELATFQIEFQIDFGSFRDLQRHRSISQRMPLLTTDLGFESWYLNELPKKLKKEAIELLKIQEEKIGKLKVTDEEKQYYIAMGYKVANRITANLPALVYTVELRSSRFAHPTVRIWAHKVAKILNKKLAKYGLVLHLDDFKTRFDSKRGLQDIVLKK